MQIERYAALGDPIAHSLSPAMHMAAFAEAGYDASYEKIRVSATELEIRLSVLRDLDFRGLNLTVPLKEAAVPLMDDVDDEARDVGAVNAVAIRHGRMIGCNTDVEGFLGCLQALERRPDGDTAVLFGAGGAARAVLVALGRIGMTVTIINRDETRACRLASAFAHAAAIADLSPAHVQNAMRSAALVINATSLGMSPQAGFSPVPADVRFAARSCAIDLVYGRLTPFLAQARAAACPAIDGLEMLVQQGAAAIRLWTDIEPCLDIMRAACRQELARRETCSVS